LLALDPVYEAMRALLAAVEPLMRSHPVPGAIVFLLLSAVAAVLAFFSSALLVPGAVLAWGAPLTILLLWAGWLLGGLAMFALGRRMRPAEGLQARLPPRIAAHLPTDGRALRFPLVLLWQLALPSEIPGYLCGLLGVPLRTYVAALALGELPYAVAATLLGESVVDRRPGLLLAIGALVALAAFVVVRALHRHPSGGES
jgi:uncharacterized membrane protein YdjX (TVP38/TMEM64 family)